jgi:xanthine dehydrogenase accessory factor
MGLVERPYQLTEVFMNNLVVIKGGGDLATGIAHRLRKSGIYVVITELAQPTVIRRSIAFAQAVFTGEAAVEGITGRLVKADEIWQTLAQGIIPVVIDPEGECIDRLRPWGVVDAIIAKTNTGTDEADAPVVIGVGPGFTAGLDVHAVVETARGHDLGRVYYEGAAQADTGIPGNIGGYTIERLIKAPVDGIFKGLKTIGDTVKAGEPVAEVNEMVVSAAIDGVLRGLLHDGLPVYQGMKIGDIDPRCRQEHCFTISDKARAIGGGVLEALLCLKGERLHDRI